MAIYTQDDVIPFIGYDGNFMIGRNGEYTLGYRMYLPAIFTLSEEIHDKFVEMYCKGIRILPDFCRIHRQDFISYECTDLSKIETNNYFEKSYIKDFSKRPCLHQDSYIYFTLIPPIFHETSVINSSTFKSKGFFKFRKEHLDEFKEKVEQFIAFMESVINTIDEGQPSYINFKILTPENYLTSVSNKHEDGVLAKHLFLGETSYSDISYDSRTTQLRVGENIVEIYTLSSLKEMSLEVQSNINYEIYNLPASWGSYLTTLLRFPHCVNTYIIKGNTELEKQGLETRRNYLQALSRINRSNGLGADEINSFLNYAEENKASIIDVHINIIVWDKSEKSLAIKRQSIGTTLSNYLNCENPKVECYNKLNLFIASLPGNVINIFKEYRFKTIDSVGAIMNNYTGLLVSDIKNNGNLRVIDRLSQSPIEIDLSPKNGDNKNKFVVGGSGSGKSFNMNCQLTRKYQTGAHIFIIDMGKSYEGLHSAFGGVWFEYTKEKPLSFNPFILSKWDWNEETQLLETEKMQALSGIIKVLWKSEAERFDQTENNIVKDLLTEYYRDSTITIRKFDTLYEFAMKFKFNDEISFDKGKFFFNLKPYYRGGSNSQLLNADLQNSLINERLVIFELDNIKKDATLLSITTTVIMDAFATKMRNISGEKIIVFEEAWSALSNTEMTLYIQWLAKTARKYNAELIIVTQELKDIVNSSIGATLINNCYIKILLDQSSFKNNFDDIQKFVGLSDYQKAQVLSINKGKTIGDPSKDFFVGFQNGHSYVVQLSTSRAEALLYTSKQDEKNGIRYVAKKLNLTYAEAITYIIDNLIEDIDKRRSTFPDCKFVEAIEFVLNKKMN